MADLVLAVIGIVATLGFFAYLIRLAIVGSPEREAETRAREHFLATGHWPDEEPGDGPAPLPSA